MRSDVTLDLSSLPKELRLLLMFVQRESAKGEALERVDEFEPINWDSFLQLAGHHRIYPYIYNQLKKTNEDWIPSNIKQAVYREFQRNTFHMLQLSGEMEKLCRRLTEAQIQVLLLKGPALAADLYGDVSKRTCSDLDMLVSIRDLDKTHEQLLELGYEKEDYFSTALDDWTWRHHHVNYFHRQKGIKLEIHWRLNPGPSKEPSFRELWQRKRLSALTSYPVFILGNEDLFFFLATHGARHGWSRLRWLVDIDRLVKKPLDWKRLEELLKANQVLHVGGQALLLAFQLLHTPIKDEMLPIMKRNRANRLAQDAVFYFRQMVHLHKEPMPEDIAQYHKRHLFSLMSNRQKLLYLLSCLYPYPMDAETMPLPKNLHFLYIPLRPFLWAWRKIQKAA